MVAKILHGGGLLLFYIFNDIPSADFGFEKFSRLSLIPFSNLFFNLCLFEGARSLYSQILVIFLFSERSDSFLI